MLRPTVFLIIACSAASSVYGTDCSLGTSQNFLQTLAHSCPPLLSPEKTYCCFNVMNQSVYCCDSEEFALKTGLGIIVPAIIAVVVVVSFIIFCISCLCCSCCPWYRRRHRGTIYGKVERPSVVHVIQTPGTMQMPPIQPNQNAYVYPANQTVTSHQSQAPPQYTVEAYSKQAPYNPNYGQ